MRGDVIETRWSLPACEDLATSGSRFPLPVSFDNDTPTPDFCRIVPAVDGMTTRTPLSHQHRFIGGGVNVDVVVNGNQVLCQYRLVTSSPTNVGAT